MATLLVTGGAGFIGSSLTRALLDRGDHVRVFDNFSSGRLENLGAPHERLEVVSGDLTDLELLRRASQGVEMVFHLAMPLDWSDPLKRILTQHAAATGTMHVLIAAREAGVRRVMYGSCGSVYGLAGVQPVNEDHPLAPLSDYATVKDTGEKDCYAFSYLYGLETVRLRFFNVYGPGQHEQSPHAGFVYQVLKSIFAGHIPPIPRDGTGAMDLLFVYDAVHALLLAASTPRTSSKVYNIGCGQAVSPLYVLEIINRLLAIDIHPGQTGSWPKSEFHNVADIKKAETELGFCPAVKLEEGLRDTIDSWLQAPPPILGVGEPPAAQAMQTPEAQPHPPEQTR